MQREPPLRDDELKVLRGMIDQYRYHMERSRLWGRFFADTHVVVVTIASLLLLAGQAISIYLAVRR